MPKKIKISLLGCALLLFFAVIIMVAKPFSENMSETAHFMLGGIIVALGIWIFKPFNLPYAVGGLFLAMFALILGLAPAVVFSGFSQPAVWTLIPALFFGYTLQKTGLGKRIAFEIIKLFKPSYGSLVLALVLIGIVLSILTPSITVRVAIIIPIALQCCELCKLEKRSKGNSLILLTAFAMALIPGSGWLSGLLSGPIMQSMFENAGMENILTFRSWFDILFLPMMLVTAIVAVGGLILLRPSIPISKNIIDEIKARPTEKISRHECITALVLSGVFVMFLTSSLHGIPDVAVCLAAVFIFYISGVLESKDFNTGVNWDLVIFIGIAISLGPIFFETGISQWLAGIIVPAISPITGNPWVFVFVITTIMFLWRFVDVAIFIPTMAIVIPILPDIQAEHQIHPLIWVAVLAMASNAFFMTYQNIWAMMSRSMAGDRAWENEHLSKYGVIYFAACMIALTVAIPMWINAGLFG
ncbi:MAG: SLC13 family permease [Spirochaetes bacterium]|nr:SLC13 family permease [Spirochaetota bacterium]